MVAQESITLISEDDEDEDTDFTGAPRFHVDDISEFVRDNRFATQPTEYEQILRSCGYGWFQRILLLVCGWAFISDSIEIQVFVMFYCSKI